MFLKYNSLFICSHVKYMYEGFYSAVFLFLFKKNHPCLHVHKYDFIPPCLY